MAATRVITVVGCHAEGEQGDVITGGVLPPPGETMMAKKLAFERDHDDIRRLLICEPRGSVARHVNLIVPPTRDDCAAGAIIMEPTEYPPMSGSNTMCIATVLLETGVVPMVEPESRFRLDMPAGPVDIVAECRGGKCVSVTLKNVPAFAFAIDAPLEVDGLGSIDIDIAYGGMIYAIVDAAELGFDIVPDEARDLAVLGEQIRLAARDQHPVVHPQFADISGVSIVQFAGPLTQDGNRVRARNTCIVSPGRSDRSPTGTGTTARMAALHARGVLGVGGGLTHSSIIGSEFHGTIVGETSVGPFAAIEATIRGRAWITGLHHYFVDADDPWPSGYVLSDTWGTSTSVSQ
ncbi:MAG TPA: proline racemase family protein [Ilumatobacteraceae bacterium]|nr:proline racemase family protein [Ilumatobacteraceae bacterium]